MQSRKVSVNGAYESKLNQKITGSVSNESESCFNQCKEEQKKMSDLMITSQSEHLSEELNFTAFIDLCRFCSIKSGPRLNIFDKEAEQRQILFKIRTILPIVVSSMVHFQHKR